MKHKDWTGVLQERLRDAELPMVTDERRPAAGNYFSDKFAEKPISAPLSADGRMGWWPWALAGVAAAAVAAVLLLRPFAPSSVVPAPASPYAGTIAPNPEPDSPHSGLDPESLIAQNTAPVRSALDNRQQRSLPDGAAGNYFSDRFAEKPIPAPLSAAGQEAEQEQGLPSAETAQNEDGEPENELPSSKTDNNEDGKGIQDQVWDERPSVASLNAGALADIAQNDFPEEPSDSRRAARRPRLTLHVQASSGGTSIAVGNNSDSGPMALVWSENRTEIKETPSGRFSYLDSGMPSSGVGPNSSNPNAPNGETVRIIQVMNSQTVVHTVPQAPAFPVSFGLNGELALNRRWSLLAGLDFTQRAGYRMNGSIPQALTLNYLGVPLETRFHFLPEKRFRLYLGTGLKAEKCIFAKGGEPLKDPVLFSWNLQAGADFRLVPGVRLYLAPVVSQYLNRSAYANSWDEKPQFSLRAGLSFDL